MRCLPAGCTKELSFLPPERIQRLWPSGRMTCMIRAREDGCFAIWGEGNTPRPTIVREYVLLGSLGSKGGPLILSSNDQLICVGYSVKLLFCYSRQPDSSSKRCSMSRYVQQRYINRAGGLRCVAKYHSYCDRVERTEQFRRTYALYRHSLSLAARASTNLDGGVRRQNLTPPLHRDVRVSKKLQPTTMI